MRSRGPANGCSIRPEVRGARDDVPPAGVRSPFMHAVFARRTLGQGRTDMMKTSIATALALAAATSVSFTGRAIGQDETDQRFGTVHFETSCNEAAQRRFDRGMRYQHSFWYQSSKEIFEDALKADPECAIAYWGIALSLLYNPHSPPPAPSLPAGLAAIEKGKAVGAKTPRERDYLEALAVFYTDYDKVPHGARVQKYLKAMEALAQKYPNDDEAQIPSTSRPRRTTRPTPTSSKGRRSSIRSSGASHGIPASHIT